MSSSTETNLTTREQDMLIKAWQCMDTQPKIDTKQLAALCGYTEQSASTLWSKLKKKIAAGGGGDSTPVKKTPTSKKKSSKKRKVDEVDDSGDELTTTTPTPKQKRGGPVKKKEESESGDEIKVEDFV